MPVYTTEIQNFLHGPYMEGPQQLEGYIPCNVTTGGTANYRGGKNPEKYIPMGVSGVTVGTGVDLGQTSATILRAIGIPDPLIALFRPFLGKRKHDAVMALYQNRGLFISPAEADVLDTAMLEHHIAKIAARYDRDAGAGSFERLPWQAQAVIVSIQYQRGVNSLYKYPNTWAAFVRQDWRDASIRLKTARLWTGYQERRRQEGLLLESLLAETAHV